MKKSIFSLLLFSLIFLLVHESKAQTNEKIPLDHSVYNGWKNLSNIQFTKDGLWVSYEIKPAKGDGKLYIYNTEKGTTDSIARATRARFSPDGSFLVFKIIPQYDTLRQMKLNKVRRNKLPKDSMGVLLLAKDSLIKIPQVKIIKMADSAANFIVYQSQKSFKPKKKAPETSGWWIFKKTIPAKPMAKLQKGNTWVVYYPLENKQFTFRFVDEIDINHDGRTISFVKQNDVDTLYSTLDFFDTKTKTTHRIFDKNGTLANFSFSRDAQQWAYLYASDTAKKDKVFGLYMGKVGEDSFRLICDTLNAQIEKGSCPSINSTPYFSKDGSKLYFGIAATPKQQPKDSLLKSEKYSVDIWNYKDKYLQPQQKLSSFKEKRRTYLCVYHFDMDVVVPLENQSMKNVSTIHHGNSHTALGSNFEKYGRETSWDGWYADYYIVNTLDGSKDEFLTHFGGRVSLSSDGAYALYYKPTDSSWWTYDIKARKHTNITKDIPVAFYNEENDIPKLPSAYGSAGWYKNDKFVVLYDAYDLWLVDPSGKNDAKNLTQGFGRKNKIKFRSMMLDHDHKYFNDETYHWLMAFNKTNKQSGYYTLNLNELNNPKQMLMGDYRYYRPQKPKNGDLFLWRRMSFNEYPELFISGPNFKEIRKITNTNPQQSKYLWGTVELTKWKAFDGQELEGLIYKPENFDPNKKYPMIVYFYEKYSDNLHYHYIPKPSHSTVNFTEYTSNGYVVFVPNITYKVGHPAKSAYNAIVSGTEFMKKNAWIDAHKIGIQGQSWGGYQVAMLVTMTDIYACAESGAPVSNMTSAYGGIRWGSGMNRAFQYEKTQSRIGYTLWDSLDLYIENSPIFFAPKVTTPLLIMHNDKDGAVPWYQGIEYFTALRRLDKKVWMLSYNNDDHNLMKWPNRVDLSIRMMQFFNHYLKGQPMPIWMKEGLPAVDKGIKTGYETE